MIPKSNNHGHSPPSGGLLGADINIDDFKVINALFGEVIAIDRSMFNIVEDSIEWSHSIQVVILMVSMVLCTCHHLFLLLLGLELMIEIIKRRNQDRILLGQNPIS